MLSEPAPALAAVDAQQLFSRPPPSFSLPVHEYVELRRFKRAIRRRAHGHALLRLVSACIVAAIFVVTFLQDSAENERSLGFAPKAVAAAK
jgi:hypothetical protein